MKLSFNATYLKIMSSKIYEKAARAYERSKAEQFRFRNTYVRPVVLVPLLKFPAMNV